MPVLLKHISETPSRKDGARVYVDRIWPRGFDRDEARLSAWLPHLGPSPELNAWWKEHPTAWTAFRKRYFSELDNDAATLELERVYELALTRDTVTLLSNSRNENNHARLLKELIDGMRKPPSSSGPARAAASGRQRAVRPR